jgi:acid phosphatase class B
MRKCNMPPEDRVRLLHMTDAADDAIAFMAGRTRAELDQDRKTLLGSSQKTEKIVR